MTSPWTDTVRDAVDQVSRHVPLHVLDDVHALAFIRRNDTDLLGLHARTQELCDNLLHRCRFAAVHRATHTVHTVMNVKCVAWAGRRGGSYRLRKDVPEPEISSAPAQM